MKKILLPLMLLLSVNFAFAEDIMLDAPVINLGYMESANGLPFNQTFTFTRNDDTPKLVDLIFSYTQTEMICADRTSDGGGCGGGGCGGCGGGGCHEKSFYNNCWGNGCGGSYNNGYDRNFMGICRNWTTMETQKSGRARLIFKKGFHNDEGDTIKVNIHQRDLHSTAFWIKGWASNPNDYYKVINLDRTVIFK
jgi:hypothetical protein